MYISSLEIKRISFVQRIYHPLSHLCRRGTHSTLCRSRHPTGGGTWPEPKRTPSHAQSLREDAPWIAAAPERPAKTRSRRPRRPATPQPRRSSSTAAPSLGICVGRRTEGSRGRPNPNLTLHSAPSEKLFQKANILENCMGWTCGRSLARESGRACDRGGVADSPVSMCVFVWARS